MKAFKIPLEQRLLLLQRGRPVTRLQVARTLAKRWGGEFTQDVLTDRGLRGPGYCGHASFWRWRIWLHRHRDARPVPEDMQAALRGEAPVPDWFLKGQRP